MKTAWDSLYAYEKRVIEAIGSSIVDAVKSLPLPTFSSRIFDNLATQCFLNRIENGGTEALRRMIALLDSGLYRTDPKYITACEVPEVVASVWRDMNEPPDDERRVLVRSVGGGYEIAWYKQKPKGWFFYAAYYEKEMPLPDQCGSWFEIPK